MTSANLIMLFAILAYLAVVVGIGVVLAKKNHTTEDFYLGGRKLGPFVTAMSAEASDMSSWLLMGLPGVAYVTGLADAAWTAIGLAVGTYVNWLIVAKGSAFTPMHAETPQRCRCFSQTATGMRRRYYLSLLPY